MRFLVQVSISFRNNIQVKWINLEGIQPDLSFCLALFSKILGSVQYMKNMSPF